MSRKSRPRPERKTKIETLEVRQVMSADPIGGLLEQHSIVEEPPTMVQHSMVEDIPSLVQHDVIPPLDHHDQPDYWLDSNSGYTIDDAAGDLEQTLDEAHNQTGLSNVWSDYGFTGSGQTVVVIDSGIAWDHYALGGGYGSNYRVVGGWDFAEDDADPYDDGSEGSHGTHVAGIIGGTGDGNGNDVGVASGVDIVGLRVFDDAGDGHFGWVEEALQWVHANRNSFEHPITTVNLSLGTTWNADQPPGWAAFLEDDFAQLELDGIFISVSAGNSFTSYNTPGLSYPAASDYVVPVMSTDDNGLLSYYSQRHESAIAAPGRFIRSTVPDYAGNHNGIADDWANFSGTSMAAPYVAGASVLIRQAMDLVGYSNITQDTIYDHMRDTADTFFDSATGQNYKRLNLEAAIDALMPDDDYGSTAGTGYSLGTISDDAELSGMISGLADVDYFTFTAGVTGTVTFSAATTHELGATWEVTSSGGTTAWQAGEDCVIDVVAGQIYTVGIKTTDGLGHYDLSVTAEGEAFSFVDWGAIGGQSSQNGLSNSGESWYRIVAGQDGYVTAEAFFAGSYVDIALFNAAQTQVASATQVAGGERIDYVASAGQELYLRVTGTNADIDVQLTNLVNLSEGTLSFSGTAGNDTVTFSAGSEEHELTVNGVDYTFSSESIDTVELQAGTGNDSIEITGTSASETATVRFDSTTFESTGFELTANDFDDVTIHGGGGSADLAYLYDTTGSDSFTGWSDRATLTGTGYSREVQGFAEVTAYASSGYDTAVFYDTAGNDTYTTWWNRAMMYGDGFQNDAHGFDQTIANASTGDDKAVFRDSAGNDTFSTWWNRAIMYGTGYWNEGKGFDRTYAFASTGDDNAVMRDSGGDDVYTAWSDRVMMDGNGFTNDARGFDSTLALSTGGLDEAILFDTTGDDTYSSWWDRGIMYGDGYWNDVRGFDVTEAYASQGYDKALFRDSNGNDTFSTWSDRAIMYGTGYWNEGNNFDRAYGFASGGTDKAVMRDSAGNDNYTAWSDRVVMAGAGYNNDARDFESTIAHTSTGYDTATFFDTSGDDTFSTWWNRGIMYGDGYWNDARGFDNMTASASGGTDRAVLRDSSAHDEVYASGATAYIESDNYHNEVTGFDQVDVYDTDEDGSDEAFVGAVDEIFNLFGDWNA